MTRTGAAQAQAALTALGLPPSAPQATNVGGQLVPPTEQQMQDYWNALAAYVASARSAVKAAFDNAEHAAQANFDQATIVLQTLLASLPIRPPAALPRSWTPPSVAQTSVVYGNVRSWLEGMKRTTVTNGVHSIVYSPSQAPEATPAQTNPTVPQTGTGSGGSPFTTFSIPNVSPTNLPVSNVAQASELYGDQYAYVGGTQYSAVTNDKTSVVAGHVSSTIRSGQDVNIWGGKTTTIYGTNSTTVHGESDTYIHGVQIATNDQIHITADVVKLAVAVATASAVGISLAVHILKMDFGGFVITNDQFSHRIGHHSHEDDQHLLDRVGDRVAHGSQRSVHRFSGSGFRSRADRYRHGHRARPRRVCFSGTRNVPLRRHRHAGRLGRKAVRCQQARRDPHGLPRKPQTGRRPEMPVERHVGDRRLDRRVVDQRRW